MKAAKKTRKHKNAATIEDVMLMMNTGILDTQMFDFLEKLPGGFTVSKPVLLNDLEGKGNVFLYPFPGHVLRSRGKTLRAAVLSAMSILEKSKQ